MYCDGSALNDVKRLVGYLEKGSAIVFVVLGRRTSVV